MVSISCPIQNRAGFDGRLKPFSRQPPPSFSVFLMGGREACPSGLLFSAIRLCAEAQLAMLNAKGAFTVADLEPDEDESEESGETAGEIESEDESEDEAGQDSLNWGFLFWFLK